MSFSVELLAGLVLVAFIGGLFLIAGAGSLLYVRVAEKRAAEEAAREVAEAARLAAEESDEVLTDTEGDDAGSPDVAGGEPGENMFHSAENPQPNR